MKLNLGSGRNKIDGYVNVDRAREFAPDVLYDLEDTPWPWPDGDVHEACAHHVLEHLGRDPIVFFRIVQELYRVCRKGALVHVTVPHPRSDNFLADPTHVRPLLPQTFAMLSRRVCERGGAMTPLALMLGVNFEIEGDVVYGYTDYGMAIQPGHRERTAEIAYNIVNEIKLTLRRI